MPTTIPLKLPDLCADPPVFVQEMVLVQSRDGCQLDSRPGAGRVSGCRPGVRNEWHSLKAQVLERVGVPSGAEISAPEELQFPAWGGIHLPPGRMVGF